MLRINLLPAYVNQRRWIKKLIPIFAAVFAVFVAVPLAYSAYLHKKLTDITQQADTAVQGKTTTDGLRAQAVATIGQVKPIQDKLDFVDAVHAYDRAQVARFNTLADTSAHTRFIYSAVAVAGATMNIKAWSPSVEDVGRYLQVMYQEPDFQSVVVDHIPGYPDNGRNLYYLNGRMVFADGASGAAGTGATPSGGGQSSYPGQSSSSSSSSGQTGSGSSGGGGQQTAAGSGAPSNYTPASIGPNAVGSVPPDVGPPPAELTGGAPTGGNSGPTPGGGFSGGGGTAVASSGGYSPAFLKIANGLMISPFAPDSYRQSVYRQLLRRVVKRTAPKGFDINVTATLKQPLTPPSLPGAAPAAAPGGRGGFPGAPGGPPGSPRTTG